MTEIKSINNLPWKDINFENDHYISFNTNSGYIYAPKDKNTSNMIEAMKAAYEVGSFLVKTNQIKNFVLFCSYKNDIDWPHINLIPEM